MADHKNPKPPAKIVIKKEPHWYDAASEWVAEATNSVSHLFDDEPAAKKPAVAQKKPAPKPPVVKAKQAEEKSGWPLRTVFDKDAFEATNWI